MGDKNRQQTILNLGKLEGIPKEMHKLLADRIESLLTGSMTSLFNTPENIESLAQKFTKQIVKKGSFSPIKKDKPVSTDTLKNYQEVDINSFEQIESKNIGGEWLVKQVFDKFFLDDLFSKIAMPKKDIGIAKMLLTAKMLHPSSELETQRWLHENSGAYELYQPEVVHSVSRYRLYKAAEYMYGHKEEIEPFLYSATQNLFSQRNTIVIYDLTNMYFEGQMLSSKKAKFGRSKQKRYDRRLIGLALSIDGLGFVRYSKIYKGNVSEPQTFEAMLEEVSSQLPTRGEKAVVVMDAGIATEDNIEIIKQKNCDYICVSRTKPKEYTKLTEDATIILDNRNNKIEVTKATVEGKSDTYLHIKSQQKQLKEDSIHDKLTERFVDSMQYLKDGLSIPRRLKKIVPVHEKVGKIKRQFSKVAKLYNIKYEEDTQKGVVTNITWEKKDEDAHGTGGEYFLRYSKEILTEKEIWDGYNLTRDIEATFRCLKTDLDIRPIFHQKDAYIEPHIWLGIIAYQFVNYIRLNLKEQGINYSWSTIVRKMQVQQYSIQSVDKKDNGKIYYKLCTMPNNEVKKIYQALGFKERPFARQLKVVTQQ